MKMRTLGLLSLALAVCLSSALVAQEQQAQQGGRGRGGPGGGGPGGGPGGGRGGFGFGGPGGGLSMGGALELISLLRMEEVQKEVEMTAETYQAVQESVFGGMAGMRDLSETERTAKMKEMNEKAKELLDEVLSPEHQKRLMGLLVQQNGNRAASNDLIAKEIGLDEAGIKKVEEAVTKAGEASRAKMQEMMAAARGGGGGAGGGFDPAKFQEMRDSMQKDTDKAIADVLTDAHKKALEALKGDKFAFPERQQFGRGGPGGGPGGGGPPGGGRTRGARPGGDTSN